MVVDDSKRQFIFTCSSPEDKKEWIKELTETLETLSLHNILNENLKDTPIKEGNQPNLYSQQHHHIQNERYKTLSFKDERRKVAEFWKDNIFLKT
jgi:hypothetical protein